MTSPAALTTTIAATIRPSGSVMDALPMPPFMPRSMPPVLPIVAPAPAPTLPSATGAGRSRFGRLISAIGARPNQSVAHRQVENRRRRDDGHKGASEFEADLLFLEIRHHAGRGIESEGAAAGQDDGVRDLHEVDWTQEVGFAGRRRRAAHVHAGGDARLGEDHRAAGGTLGQRVVADLDAWDGRQRRVSGRAARLRADRDGGANQQDEAFEHAAPAHSPVTLEHGVHHSGNSTSLPIVQEYRYAWKKRTLLRPDAFGDHAHRDRMR